MWGKRTCVVVLLALALAACGGPSWEDYKAAATNGTMADRELHDRWVADRFAEVEKSTPWAEWGPARTVITCEVDRASSFGQADPNTVSCASSWVRQAGFDGELPDRIRSFDDIVRAHEWFGHADSIAQPIDYYRQFRVARRARTGSTTRVTFPASVTPGTWTTPLASDSASPGPNGTAGTGAP